MAGANVEVIEMLKSVHHHNPTPEQHVEQARDRNNPIRLMGFGHRV
jgi:citrate synthase